MTRPKQNPATFRPASYWDDPLAFLGSIKGENRRRIAASLVESGDFEPLDAFLLAPSLPDEVRRFTGGMHPSWMGGEYLPDDREGEVEIARIVLQSVMQDVISVRARRDEDRIRYRIVDEYDSVFRLPFASSPAPLTQRRLVSLIDRARSEDWPEGNFIFGILEMNDVDGDREALLDFVSVSSTFYPGLAGHYAARILAWSKGQVFNEGRYGFPDGPSVKT